MLEKHLFRRTALSKCLYSKPRPVQSKISQGHIVPISLCHFTRIYVHFVHFNMKINKRLHLSNLRGISLDYDLFKFKNAKIVIYDFLIWLWLWLNHEHDHSLFPDNFTREVFFRFNLPRLHLLMEKSFQKWFWRSWEEK